MLLGLADLSVDMVKANFLLLPSSSVAPARSGSVFYMSHKPPLATGRRERRS